MLVYFCPLCASNFSINYVDMQKKNMLTCKILMSTCTITILTMFFYHIFRMRDKYVDMHDYYVNMQHIYVDMQEIAIRSKLPLSKKSNIAHM